jgi:5-epi-alpha-selinene synthase
MDIPQLSAMAYPSCDATRLAIATEWCVWLFAWDDKCDRTPLGKDPEGLRREHSAFSKVLEGARPDGRAGLRPALADLRDRMLPFTGRSWLDGFRACVAEYFAGCEWEASNRARGVVPDPESYVMMRPASGAVLTAFELFALTDRDYLPEPFRVDERVRRLERAANDVICFSNDILSLERELERGDVHNLVIVLMQHGEPSLRHALERAARMHDEAVRRYQELEYVLRDDASTAAALERRCSLMRGWMAANQRWSLSTRRYRARAVERGRRS